MTTPKMRPSVSRAIYGAVMTVISFEVFAAVLPQLFSFFMMLWHPGASLASPVGVPLAVQYAMVILLSVLPLALAVWVAGRFGRRPRPAPRAGLRLQKSVPVLLPLFLALTVIASLVFGLIFSQGETMQLPARGAGLWVELLCVCIIPAVGEEWLFRGTVQPMLQPLGPWTAVWGQALLFGAAHAFGAPMLTAIISGLALGLIYTLTGDLRLGMILHGANNLLGFWECYAYQYGDASLAAAVITLIDLLVVLWAIGAVLYIKRRRFANAFYPVDLSTGHGQLLHSPVFLAAFACLVLAQVMSL